jgi:neutral ceramidase
VIHVLFALGAGGWYSAMALCYASKMPKLRIAGALAPSALLAVLLCSSGVQAQSAGGFRAGAAASNITPPLGSGIVGGWTAPPATNVHDELHARALVLDDGRTRLAIVVCDSVGIARSVFDEAKRQIHEKTGIPPANMLMSATHTHSASSARGNRSIGDGPLDEYQRFLATRIRDAVLRAIHHLEPARIGWGKGYNDRQVFNRRWKMKPGSAQLHNPFGGIDQVRMNPPANHPDLIEPAGPIDPEINFISVQSRDGKPIALLANYSLHYVGGVRTGDISADYYGMFAEEIKRLLGADRQDPPFVGILSNGTSGDVNNINFRPSPEQARRKYQPYEKMKVVAAEVAAEVFRACQGIEHRDTVSLAAASRELALGVRVPGPDRVRWAQQTQKSPPQYHAHEETYAQRILNMREFPQQVPIVLQALRIGEVGIAAIPNEVFAEMGLEIRRRSPVRQTFTMELANGWYGYLPTAAQHKLGGYETWQGTSLFEMEAATRIVNEILELLGTVAQSK